MATEFRNIEDIGGYWQGREQKSKWKWLKEKMTIGDSI